MRGARRLLAALFAAIVLVGVAGCGNGDDAYVEKLNAAQAKFDTTVKKTGARISGASSPRQDREALRSFTEATDRVVVELRQIDPPESVAALHGELVDEMDAFAAAVRSATRLAMSVDADRRIASQQRLEEANAILDKRFNRTIRAINKRLRSS